MPKAGALEAEFGADTASGSLLRPGVYRDAPGEGSLQHGGSLYCGEPGQAGGADAKQLPWVQDQLGCPALRPALLGHARWDGAAYPTLPLALTLALGAAPEQSVEAVAALYLPYISPISPPYLPHISPISPPYLAYVSQVLRPSRAWRP